MLLIKIFSLKPTEKTQNKKTKKQETNQTLSATLGKVKFCLFKKTVSGSFRQRITMRKCKAKAAQADLGIFTIQTCLQIIQTYSFVFTALCNPDIFRTLAYSEDCHIQNPGRFKP